MKSDFVIAVTQLAAERNLPKEIVISAIEAALVSAYKKDSMTAGQNIRVKLDPASGEVIVDVMKTVVEEITDPEREISVKEASKLVEDAELGVDIPVSSVVHNAGRIAAQTAKQVVMQRLREAERELVYEEYSGREGEILTGTIQRIEPRQIIVDLGRAEAIVPTLEQVPAERYRIGQKIKVYLLEVRHTSKGPEIVASRSHKDLLKRLFEIEVPEIFSGAVEIMNVAREPGSRSKVAVWARREGVDPVGSCVGLRGIRIQNIVNELQGEKIDVVEWHKDPAVFLANALSPSQVMRVELNEEANSTLVVVPDHHLSLAIGKEGQNARLAAKLTGWKVDIKSITEAEDERLQLAAEARGADVEVAVEIEGSEVEEVAKEVESQLAADEDQQMVAAVEAAVQPEAAVVEEVEVEEEEEKEKVEGVSPEEELAATSLAEDLEKEEAAPPVEKALSIDDLPEEVWSVPVSKPQEPGRLRFAEEIVGTRARRALEQRAQRQDRSETGGQRGRRGRRVRVPDDEGSDTDE